MTRKRNLPQETVAKKRKLSYDGLAPPPEMHIFQRSPSPESGLANWSRGIRGIFSNLGGGDQNNEVINGATTEQPTIFSTASSAFSTLSSQLPRLSEDVGILASVVKAKLFKGGMVDDKQYLVSADSVFLQKRLSLIPRPSFSLLVTRLC